MHGVEAGWVFQMIKEIMAAVTIPVMAKARVGHFAEAQILEALGVDMVDESEGTLPYDPSLVGSYLPVTPRYRRLYTPVSNSPVKVSLILSSSQVTQYSPS